MKKHRFLIAIFTFAILLSLLGWSNLTTTYAATPTPKPSPTMTPSPLPSPTLTPTLIPNPPFPKALKDGKLKIAWIAKALNERIFDIGKRGAQKKAYELSKSGFLKVEIVDYTPINMDSPIAQEKQINKVIDTKNGFDAIIIQCKDPQKCESPINKAVDSGIPVMTFDTDSPNSHRFTFYGVDNQELGKMAVQVLKEAFPEGGDVAVFINEDLSINKRGEGFIKGLEGTNLTLATDVIQNWDFAQNVQIIEKTMKDYPGINGMFWTFPAAVIDGGSKLTLWKAATQKGMKTVSGEALPEELDWIRAKKLYAAIDQPYWGWGYDTVQIMYDYMVYGKKFEKYTYVKPNIITLKNVNAYQDMVKKNDFSTPLPPYK